MRIRGRDGLADESRLANTCLTSDEHRPAGAVACLGNQIVERIALGLPADVHR